MRVKILIPEVSAVNYFRGIPTGHLMVQKNEAITLFIAHQTGFLEMFFQENPGSLLKFYRYF